MRATGTQKTAGTRLARNANGRNANDPGEGPRCDPVAQARLLARANTELNVMAGLCLGCDVLFASRSEAPVTALFVKDRSLAHNPVGAIYTRYQLKDLNAGRDLHTARPGRE